MKVGKISVASIVLLVFALTGFILKRIDPVAYYQNAQFFDGAMVGAGFVMILYYLNIWISAWINNRKEEKAAQNNSAL
jgi:hypothetical protein